MQIFSYKSYTTRTKDPKWSFSWLERDLDEWNDKIEMLMSFAVGSGIARDETLVPPLASGMNELHASWGHVNINNKVRDRQMRLDKQGKKFGKESLFTEKHYYIFQNNI